MATILQSMPKEASITKIEYEGPRIALYTNSPRYLLEHNETISNLVNIIKKRIVIRTDESIRKPEDECRKIITEFVQKKQIYKERYLIHPLVKFLLKQKDLGYYKEMQKNSIMSILLKNRLETTNSKSYYYPISYYSNN